MIARARLMPVAVAFAAAALGALPAGGATVQAPVNASVNKALEITRVADMSFGNILLSGTGTYTVNVSISQAGILNCPANVTCTGVTSPGTYNVSGSKQSPVQISTPSTMTLTGASGSITMAVSAPTSLVLTNSGYPGTDFNVGGTLTLTDTTKEGVYSGTFSVTADYQ